LTVAAHPEILITKINAIKILCFIVVFLEIYDYQHGNWGTLNNGSKNIHTEQGKGEAASESFRLG
jgi:hypothetical protein